jgi:hypothetical protein
MERMKGRHELLEPDARSSMFVKMDSTGSGVLPMTIDDFHEWASYVKVSENVPEDVRSYVETIKNVFVFGWCHYPFCTLAAFLATTAVEMALRKRYPMAGRDRRSFATLLKRAEDDGLLTDDRFPAEFSRPLEVQTVDDGVAMEIMNHSVAERITSRIPSLRNEFAHPGAHWIMPPGPALDMLILSAAVINALWQPAL